MLRPDKKYSVYDLRQLKGKRCLTHAHVKSRRYPPGPRRTHSPPSQGLQELPQRYKRFQDERIAAFAEYAQDVKIARFPEASHLVAMDEAVFKEAVEAIEGNGHA